MINNLFEKYTKMSGAERLFHGRRSMEVLLEHFGKLVKKDDDSLLILMSFAAASLGSDGVFTDKEIAYCQELFHLSREHTHALLLKSATKEKIYAAERLFDVCEAEIKIILLDFCMCFITSDDTISPAENSFIKSLVI